MATLSDVGRANSKSTIKILFFKRRWQQHHPQDGLELESSTIQEKGGGKRRRHLPRRKSSSTPFPLWRGCFRSQKTATENTGQIEPPALPPLLLWDGGASRPLGPTSFPQEVPFLGPLCSWMVLLCLVGGGASPLPLPSLAFSGLSLLWVVLPPSPSLWEVQKVIMFPSTPSPPSPGTCTES